MTDSWVLPLTGKWAGTLIIWMILLFIFVQYQLISKQTYYWKHSSTNSLHRPPECDINKRKMCFKETGGNKHFHHNCPAVKIHFLYFLSYFLQTTRQLFRLAPSPSSATPRGAAEALGVLGTAAICPALMIRRATMITPGPPCSTSHTWASWATPPRTAWARPALLRRSVLSFIFISFSHELENWFNRH